MLVLLSVYDLYIVLHLCILASMVNLLFNTISPISTITPQPLQQAWGPLGIWEFGGDAYMSDMTFLANQREFL